MPTSKKTLKEPHPSHSFLSDFILGTQDGLVNVLGILLGVTAATSDIKIIFVATLAALGAESISMGAHTIFFVTSTNIVYGSVASVIVSGGLLFFIGAYEAKTTIGSIWWSGLQMTIIGLAAGFAGYLIGHLIGAVPGL